MIITEIIVIMTKLSVFIIMSHTVNYKVYNTYAFILSTITNRP